MGAILVKAPRLPTGVDTHTLDPTSYSYIYAKGSKIEDGTVDTWIIEADGTSLLLGTNLTGNLIQLQSIAGSGYVNAHAGLIAGSDNSQRGQLQLHRGSGSNTPGFIRLSDENGVFWYLFVDTTGDLRIHTAAPSGTLGTVVGTQS